MARSRTGSPPRLVLENRVRPQLLEAFNHACVAAEDAEARVGDIGKAGRVVDEVV
jgi:hypothetical protein